MKIRFGFVSNSSSTAFVLCGVKLTDKQFKELTKVAEAAEYDTDKLWDGLRVLFEERMFGVLKDIDDDYSGGVVELGAVKGMDADKVSQKIEKVLGVKVDARIFMGRRCT